MKETALILIGLIEALIEVEPGALTRKSRKTKVVLARRCFYFLMRNHYNERASYQWLGSHFGQDHSTVLHACTEHRNQVETWWEYRDMFKKAEALFDKNKQGEQREDKTAIIDMLRLKYRARITLEGEIRDIERLIASMDRKPKEDE